MTAVWGYDFPYQRKNMGMIWQMLGHIWPICGNDMGRLDDGMELIWVQFLTNFKLWKMHGKESLCHPLYGRTMGIRCPYVFHRNDTFACSTSSMEVIWDVHIVMLHRLSIPTNKTLLQVHVGFTFEFIWNLYGAKKSLLYFIQFLSPSNFPNITCYGYSMGWVTKFQWQEVPVIDSSEKYHFPFKTASCYM